MALNAGDLDREVVIETLTESAGSSGFPVETWASLDTVWMQKLNATETERFKSAQISAPLVVRWHMYYRSDMDPDGVDVVKTKRLNYQGRLYDITSAVELGRQEGIELVTLASSRIE